MSALPSEAWLDALRARARLDRAATPVGSRAPGRVGPAPGAASAALLTAYRSSGGTVRKDNLAPLLQHHLARLIDLGSVFEFRWHETLWIPMFQFDPIELSVTPGLREVLRELAGVFDGLQLAVWFAEPNAWLDGRRPAKALAHDWPAVFSAAQALAIRSPGQPPPTAMQGSIQGTT